ncbi:hypothetical protein MAPG_11810 [Magnaporthiopsis poae ATCC 64411]|uniref:Uncharacterized protein n=1 Tax=Magnaporthiopsis poae (strain ATCC 64411 / 73-15) TaxID=644358 RepID=A0A0C4EG86_MAGP6|nr:hypothetical protein MAPG_11810 [Magnaporthiopsis poae ATCC 64411]
MSNILQVSTAWVQNRLLNRHDAFEFNQSTIALTLLALILLPLVANLFVGAGAKATKVPLINPPGLFQLTTQKRFEFVRNGSELLREGRRRFPGKPFRLITNVNAVTVLPPNRAKEVNDLPTLSFRKAVSSEVPLGLTGFGFYRLLEHPTEMVQKVITKHLTKRLNTVTKPLALETSFAVTKILGNKPNWFEVTIQAAALDIVARLSSRVFLGPDVCRDEKWLGITKSYTIVQNQGIYTMRLFPKFFRPIVYLFDPSCRKTRQLYYQARDIIEPVVAKRRKE